MVKLHLYGSLKEEFGTGFELEARSPTEAIRILEANFPGRFLKAFSTGNFYVARGSDFETGVGDTGETLTFEMEEDIHIAPEIEGAGRGLLLTIIGVVIIIIAVWASGGTAAGAAGAAAEGEGAGLAGMSMLGVTWGTIAMFGASLMFAGISQMLTPTPDVPAGTVARDPKASYIFQGAENIVGQGVPIPVIYGEMETGSVTMAVSLTVEDVSTKVTLIPSPVDAFATWAAGKSNA